MPARKMYSAIRTAAGIISGSRAFGGPIQASLSLTNRCNVRCIHCYYYSPYLEKPTYRAHRLAYRLHRESPSKAFYQEFSKKDCDTKSFSKLIDDLAKMGTRRFQFSGSGELFIHKDALEMMGRAKYKGAYCFCNTNGTLLNRDIIDELINIGFNDLRITLMAGTPEMYEVTHPGSKKTLFNKIIDDLLYLQDRKRSKHLDKPKITLICIVIKENHKELFDFARTAVSVGADQVQFRPIDDVKDAGLRKFVLSNEESQTVRKEMLSIINFLEENNTGHNINYFLNVFQNQLDTSELYRSIPCYYGWLVLMADADGKIYPCCRCYQPFGNIYEQSIHSIWYGEMFRKHRHAAYRIHKSKRPVRGCDCHNCVHYKPNIDLYRKLHPFQIGKKEKFGRFYSSKIDF